jgi:transcriptional regulator with XRE-family HTH domain
VKFERTIDVKSNFDLAQAKLGFSKRRIAEKSGMPAGSLGGVLTHNNPTIQQLLKLSRGLGVSISFLLKGGDPEEELKANYVFEALKDPVLRDDWKPKKPNVAARVEMTLRQTGMTKIVAAKRINAIPSWWSPILKRNNPTVVVLEKIAYALKVDPVDLVEPVPFNEYGKVMAPKVHY